MNTRKYPLRSFNEYVEFLHADGKWPWVTIELRYKDRHALTDREWENLTGLLLLETPLTQRAKWINEADTENTIPDLLGNYLLAHTMKARNRIIKALKANAIWYAKIQINKAFVNLETYGNKCNLGTGY